MIYKNKGREKAEEKKVKEKRKILRQEVAWREGTRTRTRRKCVFHSCSFEQTVAL